MQRILSEQPLSLAQATRLFPGRPAISTLHRWATRGVKGNRLEVVNCGTRKFTSEAAVLRFLERCNASQVHDADHELVADGL